MDEVDGSHAGHEVRLEPLGVSLRARANQTLLASAKAVGIGLPSSCRNGTCRTCLCRLKSGRVVYRIEWPGLSHEEKQEGFILPCVAYPVTDLVVDVPGARPFMVPT
ncbi:MAG: 2Fe-2S iron-sulfur cluster binding domain-containing protein [Rubrivivax sp.]|nr:MAG: 2Fe-2S iron-sulfur cluster binding domain-containing protein [Rubrivivax sp.]